MLITRKTLGQWILWAVLAIVLYFCFRILQPFLMPIFLALTLAALFGRFYELLLGKLKGRKNLAALIICLGLTAAIIIPLLFLSISLGSEANDAYRQIRDPETLRKLEGWIATNDNPIVARIRVWLPGSLQSQLATRFGARAQQIGVAVLRITTNIAAGVFTFLMDYIIMTVVLFFFLRDSAHFAETLRAISPLSVEQERLFIDRFRIVTRATVFGNLATALAQGAISGLIFLSLGLPNPILWGSLTALLSLVPFVGTSLIWVPWTIYLFAVGSPTRAIIFLIVQVVVVGSIDNILRPLLMEGGVKMHTLAVFFSILGGIAYFGILGMFIGPMVFAMAIALLEVCVLPASVKNDVQL